MYSFFVVQFVNVYLYPFPVFFFCFLNGTAFILHSAVSEALYPFFSILFGDSSFVLSWCYVHNKTKSDNNFFIYLFYVCTFYFAALKNKGHKLKMITWNTT